MDNNYIIELAKEFLNKETASDTEFFPFKTNARNFSEYKDQYVEIIAAKDTKALHVRIFSPLTTARENPIIYVDDNGICFRKHGETSEFIMYAESFLKKPATIGSTEYYKEKQKEINNLISSNKFDTPHG